MLAIIPHFHFSKKDLTFASFHAAGLERYKISMAFIENFVVQYLSFLLKEDGILLQRDKLKIES